MKRQCLKLTALLLAVLLMLAGCGQSAAPKETGKAETAAATEAATEAVTEAVETQSDAEAARAVADRFLGALVSNDVETAKGCCIEDMAGDVFWDSWFTPADLYEALGLDEAQAGDDVKTSIQSFVDKFNTELFTEYSISEVTAETDQAEAAADVTIGMSEALFEGIDYEKLIPDEALEAFVNENMEALQNAASEEEQTAMILNSLAPTILDNLMLEMEKAKGTGQTETWYITLQKTDGGFKISDLKKPAE